MPTPSKKITDSGEPGAASRPRPRPGRLGFAMQAKGIAPSVDKPMNIHRSECVKVRMLALAGFLSSLRPAWIQALYSGFEIT
jgi:hypothetical protein